MKFLAFVFLGIFLLQTNSFAKVEELEQFEIRSYTPQLNGVKDLVFEVRVDGLKDIIEKSLAIGKLADLYFKVYWTNPNEFRIEVEGLPKGFKEVKDDLRQLIKGKLDFVIPEKVSERLKQYTLKVEPITDGKLLKAIDETYTLAVPEIDLTFDKSGRLKLLETKMSANAVKTEFFHSPKSWSNNKLVLDRVGLPSKLVVKNVVEFMVPPEKEKEKPKLQKKETSTVLRFTKYEINTGKATRFINEGLLK
jgi:hypothetical protein